MLLQTMFFGAVCSHLVKILLTLQTPKLYRKMCTETLECAGKSDFSCNEYSCFTKPLTMSLSPSLQTRRGLVHILSERRFSYCENECVTHILNYFI